MKDTATLPDKITTGLASMLFEVSMDELHQLIETGKLKTYTNGLSVKISVEEMMNLGYSIEKQKARK